ncbi:AAA family ATPase [Streptomyces sp. NPDC002156]
MTDPLADLTRRLAAGESLEDIARSVRPPDWAPALRVCAVARTFDEPLYESILAPAAGGPGDPPALRELVEERVARPVGGAPRTYALSEPDRTSYFLDWMGTGGSDALPAELLRLEREIAEHRLTTGDHTEAVRHLLLPSSEDALSLFQERFDAADRRRDFATCQDLVEALGDPDRLPYLGPEISELGLERAGYVRARDHWSADYARSAQFLQPAGLVDEAERLLSGERRVWQLYAPGGAGKTMQLRWLVARHCVPAPRDVPCARIDFDVVNPHTVGRHPWLLLLELAEQFGRRLPGRPFESLTSSYGVYRILLDRMPSESGREVAGTLDSLDSEAIQADLLAAFADRLNLAVTDRPAVLVVDTLEELLLHGHTEAERLLRLLADLVKACPSLRLVLAGRYDLRDRIPEALRAFPRKQVKHIRVRPFTAAQARSYLTDVRGIRDSRLVRVAVRQAQGLPFKLALFADIIEQDPDITAAELADDDGPHVRYFIDRIVQRIEDPAVRWLLRYGVIPRRLRKEDVFTLMRPWLAKGITDGSDADDPRLDDHHLRGSDKVFPIAPTEPTDEDLERSWQRLLDYAAKSSWVSRHSGDDSTVVFHTNVLAPMRLLVSGHRVFGELHEAFVAHFDSLAEAHPEQWGTYTKEALYHRFQAGDPRAEEILSDALRKAGDSDSPESARELAEEVLGAEYLDEGQPRLRVNGEPLISRRAVAACHLAVAASVAHGYLGTPRTNPSDPAWSEVERRLALVDELKAQSPGPIDTLGVGTYLRALVLFGRGRLVEADELIRSVLESEAGDWPREGLQLLLSRTQTQLNDPEAEATYHGAILEARSRGDEESEARISLELAQTLEDQGRIDESTELRRRVTSVDEFPEATGKPVLSVRVDAMLRLAQTQLRTFSPSSALETLGTLDPGSLPVHERVEAYQCEAAAQHMLGSSRRALDALDQAEESVRPGIDDTNRYRYVAENFLQRGLYEGALLSVDTAEGWFARSAAIWSDLGHPDGHPLTLLMYARFLTWQLGDLRRAAQTLDRLRAVDTAGEHAVHAALLWHDLAVRGFEVPDRSLLDVPWRSPKDLIDGGVPAVLADPARATALAEALADVQPPEARLTVLSRLNRCPTPEGEPLPQLALFRPLFADSTDGDSVGVDQQVRMTLLAEFERVSGRHQEAVRLMMRAHSALCESAGDEEPLPKWRWAQAQVRFNGLASRELSRSLCDLPGTTSPLLGATSRWMLALTERDAEPKRALLNEASEHLSEVQRPSVWGQFILRSIGLVNSDESTIKAADRMSAALGYRPEPSARRTPASSLSASSEHEDVFRVDPAFRVTSAPLHTAQVLITNWRDVTVANAGSLQLRSRGTPPADTIQIQADQPLQHAFPWELAFRDGPLAVFRTLPEAAEAVDVRSVQAALNHGADAQLVTDGVWGSLSKAALGAAAALQLVRTSRERVRARSGPKALVLVCDSAFDNHSYAASGSASSSRSVLGAYKAHSLAPQEIRSLQGLPRHQPPLAVIHVSAPLRLIGGTTPCFDLSSAELSHDERLSRTARGANLEPDQLIDWLRQFEPGTQPLVVLDPPRPGSPADIPLQLVLRNLFAATLFASGHVPAVLGVGLLRGSGRQQRDLVARAVREDSPLLRLCADLRRLADRPDRYTRWGEDTLEHHCVSLFASPAALHISESAPS